MGVSVSRVAPRVVLVPVDAQTQRLTCTAPVSQWLGAQAQRLSVEGILLVQATRASSLSPRRHVGTRHDAVVRRQGADEGPLIVLLWLVVRRRQGHTAGAAEETTQETKVSR